MKETGLMFKAPLVRAILSGQKTQTRRICKLETVTDDTFMGGHYLKLKDGMNLAIGSENVHIACPTGGPGDRIYVRETWQGPLMSAKEWEDHYFSKADELPSKFKTPAYCKYAADGGAPPEFMTMDDDIVARWKPSIHMPKWAARIWLEISSVRVERLQSISRGDAMAEGCPFPNMADGEDPRDWFAEVWKSTGGDWAANPWVWVIDFKRIEKPR
ncbi:hypothetical protein [Comamonas thiooxydans]|uniref:hypothetical protein n=1 Tax=Comamonas thiooxydans TaxID=363952 RepID=UPI00050DE8ED|nr:hypothetical protein [Comamonas thiooxydans]KGH29255.1 hypothetical protein P606_02405 [Comamonas thiooxydans]